MWNHLIELLAFLAAGALSATALFALNIRWAVPLGLIDWPKSRGVCERRVPILGPSFVVLSFLTLGAVSFFFPVSPWFFVTSAIVAILGYLDDRKPMSALDKIFFQIVCIMAMLFLDPYISASIGNKYGISGLFLAGLFILGLMNAINFIDGMDGLALIVLVGGLFGYFLFAVGGNSTEPFGYFIYAATLLGMMIPFFYSNVYKRRAFLGNSGSYFLSYVLSVLHMSQPLEVDNIYARMTFSALCFLVPLTDSSMVIFFRLWTHRSPFEADKGHLHHRLMQTHLSLFQILGTFSFMTIVGLVLSYSLFLSRSNIQTWFPIILATSLLLICALWIFLLELSSKRRIQSYFQKLDSGEPIYFMKYQFTKANGQPISIQTLRRIEARVAAEIRVTDLCFSEAPNTLFVTLRTLPEPLKGISSRLENIFHVEKVQTTLVVDQGEFIKVSKVHPRLKHSA